MKLIDKILRRWRVDVAFKWLPNKLDRVFDIGCDDGYLLSRLNNKKIFLDGCDPRLAISSALENSLLIQGFFPAILEDHEHRGPYDAIFALAVFEHFSEKDLIHSSMSIAAMLSENGRLIVTVPHPFVDKILDVLHYLRLIDGQALEEHHGFDPETLVDVLSKHLSLVRRESFQLGLNNIFIFSKLSN